MAKKKLYERKIVKNYEDTYDNSLLILSLVLSLII